MKCDRCGSWYPADEIMSCDRCGLCYGPCCDSGTAGTCSRCFEVDPDDE